ncbi:CD225/dispanin family protein [Aquimarina sp. 2201CG5-10]|uniref:CD225/dispanin family protein n=1 Tax=Aquimarina callyspongiae TaxID=3098150 RepID=UPI002AB54863|nr:CD225/dispanin family protein [Aquimarina sp. 2201CG5-10]MDY8138973.1 CD225/dispanin family protein [Aquimarina sp. 2201CG5-10]
METNQPRPKNYLVESILATLFCCLPLGIVAIIHASKVNSAYDSGNHEEAQRASDDAKKWMKYAVISGIVVTVLYLILVFGLGIGGAMLNGGY